MKGDILVKVVVEATILAEKRGLFVDFVTCDGACWNRNMWKRLGIGAISQRNCDQGELASLLQIDAATDTLPQDDSVGSASTVDEPSSVPAPIDHNQHIARSDSRLIFYVAGYIARKCVMKTNCEVCITLLMMPAQGEDFQLARLTTFRDKGGLLYPSSHLYSFVSKLENMFTECFSCHKLHSDSILDVLAIVKERFSQEVGCAQHAPGLSKDVISFYIVTRLHFFVKDINSDRSEKREKAKHLKLSRCS
nr:uncharacterized protein LOC119178019 [Rhipicephalus microplus]